MKETTTERGFVRIEFCDLSKAPCSLQESSLATREAIWLGVDDADPRIMAKDAQRLGLIGSDQDVSGWIPFSIPEEVLLRARMHLDREQAYALGHLLLDFARSGRVSLTSQCASEHPFKQVMAGCPVEVSARGMVPK